MLDPIVATLKTRIDADPRSRREIAAGMFISNSYLSDILNGRRMPTMWMLRPMLEYFDLELETVSR